LFFDEFHFEISKGVMITCCRPRCYVLPGSCSSPPVDVLLSSSTSSHGTAAEGRRRACCLEDRCSRPPGPRRPGGTEGRAAGRPGWSYDTATRDRRGRTCESTVDTWRSTSRCYTEGSLYSRHLPRHPSPTPYRTTFCDRTYDTYVKRCSHCARHRTWRVPNLKSVAQVVLEICSIVCQKL